MTRERERITNCTLSFTRERLYIRNNMLHLLILMLTSCCITLCSLMHREYYVINEDKTWDQALSYCRNIYTDLATIGSRDDMERLVTVTEAIGLKKQSWIGLKETGVSSWLWSAGETLNSNQYNNWASSPTSSHYCGGMRADGKWLSALCETTLPFACKEDKPAGGMNLVLEGKSWREAQEYCRLSYADLASVRSQTENQVLQQIINENVPPLSLVWIGLFRDEWKWSDQSNSSLRYWEKTQPNNDGLCALYSPDEKKWYDRGCTTKRPSVCYKATGKRQMVVRVEMKSNSLLIFSDSALGEAILNQIQQKYEGITLLWRVQPDGKIFHKKEKEKIIEGCSNNLK